MSWTVCIDFGTAFSKAAAAPAGAWTRFDTAQVRPLALRSGEGGNPFLLDSAVFVDDADILFGSRAVARAAEIGGKRQALRSFKTILSAPDLERALSTQATGSVDPTRTLRQRDLVVLYLAFLMAAAERAVAADPALSGAGALAWRYASPAWRDERIAAHRVIERMFGEARVVRDRLQLSGDSVSQADARAALEAARTSDAAGGWRMDMVYEATAAAACSAIALSDRSTNVIVVDVGAGTTDIAALSGAHELPDARGTLTRAGDFLDRVLLNLALSASPQLKTSEQQAGLWSAMAPHVRDLKENLFASGRAAFRHGDKVINLKLSDFERDKDFKQFAKELEKLYASALKALREHARKEGRKEIFAMAVGGGAPAPFIQKLIRTQAGGGVKVTPRPIVPEWTSAAVFGGNLAPVYAQWAVAIGGALAPEDMLAAYDRSAV